MDLGQLETFLVVAREKSFSRAAERLYRTQPAVSLALKRLEDELGETLLDRTTKGGTLTDAGTTLLPLAQRMLDLRKQILDTFGSLKGLQQGRLNIGANDSVSEFLLPGVLLAYQQAHPAIRIQFFHLYRLPVGVILPGFPELGLFRRELPDNLIRTRIRRKRGHRARERACYHRKQEECAHVVLLKRTSHLTQQFLSDGH